VRSGRGAKTGGGGGEWWQWRDVMGQCRRAGGLHRKSHEPPYSEGVGGCFAGPGGSGGEGGRHGGHEFRGPLTVAAEAVKGRGEKLRAAAGR
jgi:hypothetical protein